MLKIGLSIPSIMASEDGTVFVRSGVLRSPFVITRTQAAGVQSSAINGTNDGLTFYGADVPRFTGSAQRLLIEGQGTNSFSNPWFEGAVAGNPGTTPTDTNTSFFQGLSREIVGFGTEGKIPYIDLRFFGTATGGTFSRFGLTNITTQGLNISGNAVSTFSTFVRMVNGSLSQISDVRIGIQGRDAGGSTVSGQSALTNFTPTSNSLVSQRRSVTFTPSDVTVIYGEWFIDIVRGGTATVDVTLRIGGIQHELGAFASSLILPPVGTPGASTRGGDAVSTSLSSLGIAANGACTVLWSGVVPNIQPAGPMQIWQIDDGANTNRMYLRINQNTSNLQTAIVSGGTANAGSFTAGSPFKIGCSYDAAGRMASSLNGAAVVAITGGALSGATAFRLGRQPGGGSDAFMETGRLRILPYSVSDAELQSLVIAL